MSIPANNFLHLDEKNHVEEPFLTQLHSMPCLHWEILHLAMGSEQKLKTELKKLSLPNNKYICK